LGLALKTSFVLVVFCGDLNCVRQPLTIMYIDNVACIGFPSFPVMLFARLSCSVGRHASTSRTEAAAMASLRCSRSSSRPPSTPYCWLEFAAPPVTAGSKLIQVFTQWAPVDRCPSSGNNRGNHIGTWQLKSEGGNATFIETFGDCLNKREQSRCPPPGTVQGVELVGSGQNIDVQWVQAAGKGVSIKYKN
jgi:hypothetical protein